MSLPKGLFGFFHKMVQKNSNKLFGQPKTYTYRETETNRKKKENRQTDKQKDRQADLYIKRLLHMK